MIDTRFAKDGRTVLLSTHIVEDVYQLCDELAVLRKCRLFFNGSAEQLMHKVDGRIKILQIESEEQLISLQKKTVVISAAYERNKLIVRIMDEHNMFRDVVPAVATLEDADEAVCCVGRCRSRLVDSDTGYVDAHSQGPVCSR